MSPGRHSVEKGNQTDVFGFFSVEVYVSVCKYKQRHADMSQRDPQWKGKYRESMLDPDLKPAEL